MTISIFPEPETGTAIKSAEGELFADVSRYGQLITGLRHDDVLVRFEYSNSTDDVELTTSGTGATANSSSMASVSPGAGVGAAAITSLRSTAYRPGHEVYAFFTTLYAAPEANTYQRHGLFDVDNGFFFGYEGVVFGVTLRDGAADTQTTQANWNRDTCDGSGESGFDLDHATLNQYKITYGWLGSAPVSFWVYGGDMYGWILAHVIDITNSATAPTIGEPSQRVNLESGRTTGTGVALLTKTSSWAAGTIAGEHTHAGHRVFAGERSATLTATVETHIATFRNKATFQGKTNKVRIEATYIGIATDGNKSVIIRFYKNSTLTGATYVDVDAANSVTDIDTAGTITANGKYEMSIPVSKVDTASIVVGAGHVHLELLPGETMTVTGQSANASDVIISFRWEEYFS